MATAKRKRLKQDQKEQDLLKLRLDKWLWAARFFKTRKLASEAIAGGKVHVNQMRVKPARNIVRGDRLDITRGEEVFSVEVIGLNDKRRPASEAVQLYEESAESIERREQQRALRKISGSGMSPGKKPDKHQRRKIRKFKQGGM